MELDLLRSFLAVVETRSFSGAAREVHLAQPTLSRHIARLEREFGTPLLERYGRHVECTVAGEVLLPLARAIVTHADQARSLLRKEASAGPGTVRFGAVGQVFARLLTPSLVSFLTDYPKVSVHLVEKDDAQLEEAVLQGELDCAVITPWGPTQAASHHLLNEPIVLVVPPGHRLANLSTVPLSKLAGESILLPRATMNVGNIVADAMRRAGIEPRLSYRATYPELSNALVRRGLGVAPRPKMMATPETLEELIAVPFEKPLTRDLCLIYPPDRRLPAQTRALMAYVRQGVSDGAKGSAPVSSRE